MMFIRAAIFFLLAAVVVRGEPDFEPESAAIPNPKSGKKGSKRSKAAKTIKEESGVNMFEGMLVDSISMSFSMSF